MPDYYYNPGNARKGLAAASNSVAGIGLANAGNDLTDMRVKWETPGNRIFLRRGSIQQINSLYFDSGLLLGNGTGVQVRLYGDSDAEHMFASSIWYIDPTDNGWVHQGGGLWRYTFPSSNAGVGNVFGIAHVWRGIRFGDYPSQFIGRDTSRRPNQSDVTAEDRYHFVPGVHNTTGCQLHMYTGSTTVHPGTYFGGIAITPSGDGSFPTSYGVLGGALIQNAKHCSIEGLATIGGGWRFIARGDTAYAGSNEDNQFLGCAGYAGYVLCHVLNFNNTAANRRLYFDDCEFDFLSGPEGTMVGFNNNEQGTEDCVTVRGWAEAIQFRNLTANAARHTCLQVVPDTVRAPDSTYPRGVSVAGLSCDLRHRGYGRALGMNCDGWTITDATIKNQITQSQLSGIGRLSRFTMGCIPGFRGAVGTADYSTTEAGNDNAIAVSLNGSGPSLSTVKDIEISFGTIGGMGNYAFRIEPEPSFTMTTAVLKVRNVTIKDDDPAYFLNRRQPNGSSVSPVAYPSASIMLRNQGSAAALDPMIFQNCAYIVPSGQTGNIALFDSDTSFSLTWTQYGENGLTGHTGNAAYTSLAAAGLDQNLRPVAGSPLMLAGNATASGHRDADGLSLPARQILPVGAYAAKPLRTMAVLP